MNQKSDFRAFGLKKGVTLGNEWYICLAKVNYNTKKCLPMPASVTLPYLKDYYLTYILKT